MSKLTFNTSKIVDILNKRSNTFIRTPEPTELCELDSVTMLADWLYSASRDNVFSQETFIHLSNYLDTIPSIGEYHLNICSI